MIRFIAFRMLALASLVIFTAGCNTDYTPHVPKEQAQKMLDAWLADPSGFSGSASFEKGQQQRVVVTSAYAFSYAKDESYAKLALTDFQYQVGGETKTYTGKGVLSLRKVSDGHWAIRRLALETDQGQITTEFNPVSRTGL